MVAVCSRSQGLQRAHRPKSCPFFRQRGGHILLFFSLFVELFRDVESLLCFLLLTVLQQESWDALAIALMPGLADSGFRNRESVFPPCCARSLHPRLCSLSLQQRMLRSALRSFSLGQAAWTRAAAAPAVSVRAFSAEAEEKPKVVIVDAAPSSGKWESKAFRNESVIKYENLPISPRKLQVMCRTIRGLSAREALVQLNLSPWKKTVYLAQGISTATHHAVNDFNMDRSRLVVDEIISSKGRYHKRVDYRARGRANIAHRFHSHVVIKLREQQHHDHEIRIGRYGRTIENLKRVDSVVAAFKKQKVEKKAESVAASMAKAAAAMGN